MSAVQPRNSFRAAVLRGEKPELVVSDKDPKRGNVRAVKGLLVSRGEARRSNHRGKDRHRLSSETVTVRFKGKKHKADLINLSSGGAQIRCAFKPRLWDMVELELGEGFALECAVRWLRDGCIGLEFAHETQIECTPDERAEVLLEVIQRSFPEQHVHLHRDEPAAADDLDEDGEDHDLGNRDKRRHPLIWVGKIHSTNGTYPARLRNVSAGGALVDVNTYYPVGSEVMLELGGAGKFIANVQWTCGGKAGLRFVDAFDLNCLACAKPEVASNQWLQPSFLDQAPEDDATPWHTRWRRGSVEEIRQELEGFLKR